MKKDFSDHITSLLEKPGAELHGILSGILEGLLVCLFFFFFLIVPAFLSTLCVYPLFTLSLHISVDPQTAYQGLDDLEKDFPEELTSPEVLGSTLFRRVEAALSSKFGSNWASCITEENIRQLNMAVSHNFP